MKSSSFIKIILLFLILFTVFHVFIWKKYTGPIFETKTVTGGLSRLAYDTSLNPKKSHVYPPNQQIHLEDYKGEKFDVLVFGDSFARGAFSYGGSHPNYFQDHMKLPSDSKVLTFTNSTLDHGKKKQDFDINAMVSLVKSGFLKEKGVKHFVIETVQRLAVKRFHKKIAIKKDHDISYILKYPKILKAKKQKLKAKKTETKPKMLSFFSNRNYDAFKYNISYNFDDNAYKSGCYKVNLNKDLFSSSHPRKLLFFVVDIVNVKLEKKKSIARVNSNLNYLSRILKKQGIKLYFMPIVDKYTLYEKYIPNNNYPTGILFEEMDSSTKDYTFINTKKILRHELDKGVKDLYHQGDTHWNPEGPEAVFKNLIFEDY